MARYSLGTTCHPFEPDTAQMASVRARELGFDHIDVMWGIDPETLALPIGYYIAAPQPVAGQTMCPAFEKGAGQWEACATAFRAAPGCLLEPVMGRVVDSVESARMMMAQVPGLRLAVDTGHVASWGADPVEMLDYADHVQLRQGGPGQRQLHVDDPAGTVDFAAVLKRLDTIGYTGLLTIEYFDRPMFDMPFVDPFGATVDLARYIRALMGE